MFQKLYKKGFEIRFESHAGAILERDFPTAVDELEQVLIGVRVPISEIIGSGGGEAKVTQRLRHALNAAGWRKGKFEIKKTINEVQRESTSHEVDHVRQIGGKYLVLEIEWNNKDPFFDRDLENFKRLHAEGAISVGIVVTRGPTLQENLKDLVQRFAKQHNISAFEDLTRNKIPLTDRQRNGIFQRVERAKKAVDFSTAWADSFVSDKYGESTTHWRKLLDRISRGVGNPCPLLLIGLPHSIVQFAEP